MKIKERDAQKGKSIGLAHEGASTDHLHPFFDISQLADNFCIVDCTKDQQADFAKAIRSISKLTWGQLRQAPRKGVGYEKIFSIQKDTIPPNAQEEVIIAFRVSDIYRLIGYRKHQVFHILWVDPRGQKYSHA